jgi:hypothetical protein
MKKKPIEIETPKTPQEQDLQWFEKFWEDNYPVSKFIEPPVPPEKVETPKE